MSEEFCHFLLKGIELYPSSSPTPSLSTLVQLPHFTALQSHDLSFASYLHIVWTKILHEYLSFNKTLENIAVPLRVGVPVQTKLCQLGR